MARYQRHPPLTQRAAIVIIESAQISQQLYVGGFDHISDASDLQFMEELDAAVTVDSYEDPLQRYAATLTELDSFETVNQLAGEFQSPEIVVEGRIKPSRIMSTVRTLR